MGKIDESRSRRVPSSPLPGGKARIGLSWSMDDRVYRRGNTSAIEQQKSKVASSAQTCRRSSRGANEHEMGSGMAPRTVSSVR